MSYITAHCCNTLEKATDAWTPNGGNRHAICFLKNTKFQTSIKQTAPQDSAQNTAEQPLIDLKVVMTDCGIERIKTLRLKRMQSVLAL